MSTDVRSPGGWLNLLNARIARWLVIGTLALGGGAVAIYGDFQGAQASFFCEATLESATANTVTYSCLNPLPEGVSGAILPTDTSGIYVAENTAPATRLNLGTSTGAAQQVVGTSTSANVASGILLSGARRWLPLSKTGAIAEATSHGASPVVLAPRDSNGRKYLNATFKRGTGATVSGDPPAFIRIEVMPCNLDGVGC